MIRSQTESTISRCQWGVGEGRQERLAAVLSPEGVVVAAAASAKASAGRGGPKADKIGVVWSWDE